MSHPNKLYLRGECEYDKLPGVSITRLKELRRSPLHYQYRLQNPKEPTKSMELGTSTHIAALEPERFLREYALWSSERADGSTRIRRGKEWDEFQEMHAGKTIIRDEEYDKAIAIRDAVRADAVAMKYLAMGRPEVAMTWTDPETKTECRGRTDWITTIAKRPYIVDLKGTRNANHIWFSRDVARLDYHLQAAYYADGYETISGTAPGVIVVAVEFEPPHDVVTYVIPDDVLQVGRDQYRQLLAELGMCATTGEWFGSGRGIEQTLQLPAWAVPNEDDVGGIGLEF
jgi:hypothetical protein